MGKRMILIFILSATPLFGAGERRVITSELESLMKSAGKAELLKVQIMMSRQFDPVELERLVTGKAKEERREIVITELKRFTEEDQEEVLAYLKEEEASGKVTDLRSLWINNTMNGKMTKGVIEAVSLMEGVQAIDDDPLIQMIGSRESQEIQPELLTIEWNITRVNAACAWAQGYKGQGVIVGNIDTGVNYNHIDLADHFWRNDTEFFGSPGVDDDGNGYTDDIRGYDFFNADGNPIDDNGHGTHTAGTVAGDGTGGDSVGVAPDGRIMAMKVCDAFGGCTYSAIWSAVQYGVNNGAQVLTLSIGGPRSSSVDATARNTFNNALLAGVVTSIAAGNIPQTGPKIATPGVVPPPWRHPDQVAAGGLSGVITVGASTIAGNDAIWTSSAKGPTSWQSVTPWFDYPLSSGGLLDPDVVAPGDGIRSLRYDNNTGYTLPNWSGTSMATPHVAGLVALMLSKNPILTPAQLDSIIEMTAVDRGVAGKDTIYGSGRIDCCAAINGVVGVEEEGLTYQKTTFGLNQGMPNPFQNYSRIQYSLPIQGEVTLRIYDITGQLVRTLIHESQESGIHEVLWDGKDDQKMDLPSGVYFYQLKGNHLRTTKRLILIR